MHAGLLLANNFTSFTISMPSLALIPEVARSWDRGSAEAFRKEQQRDFRSSINRESAYRAEMDYHRGEIMSATGFHHEHETEVSKDICRLLTTITGHAANKERTMTVVDLRNYLTEFGCLGRQYYAENTPRTPELDKQVRRMSGLLEAITEVVENTRQTTLVNVWRAMIADYVNQAPKFRID